MTLIACPFLIYAGLQFGKVMGSWIQTLMRDHKEADSIAEESIRNYKTVTALGAESSMERKYVSLVRVVDWLVTIRSRSARKCC